MTERQFDALVELMAALIADNEADLRGKYSPSDSLTLWGALNAARTLLVTED